jgi:transcriptional regulator with XRE-family HTH domain
VADELTFTVARRVGAHVRTLRLRAGLTQAELAGAALSRAGVAKIETGASLPSLDVLEHLAAALGQRARDLLPDDL